MRIITTPMTHNTKIRAERTGQLNGRKDNRMTIMISTSTLSGSFAFSGDELDNLAARLEGQIITAADADYDAARKVVMITVDRRPLAIVRAANVQDVAKAVRFASDRGLPLAVRSGGHSIARYSM